MSRKTRPHTRAIVSGGTTKSPSPAGFDEVLALIEATRSRVVTAVNTALIDLYWRIGQYISRKIAEEGWGQGTVAALAEYIRARRPNARGFSASNLWRMMQFYETYRGLPKLAPLVRVLSWTHNLLIMSRSKRDEEREFYLRLCVQERWSKRQLERQLAGALFERVALSPAKLSPPVRELHPEAASVFKDSYLVEFLRSSQRPFRSRSPRWSRRKAKGFPHRTRSRFLLCR
jgi:predicted nuclease of restriction endonuclease-like (RecB) superfamily